MFSDKKGRRKGDGMSHSRKNSIFIVADGSGNDHDDFSGYEGDNENKR